MSAFSITSNRYLLVIFQQVEKWLKIKKTYSFIQLLFITLHKN